MISTHTSSDSAPSRLAGGWKTAECSTVDELGWLMLASTWSPIVWKDGYRKQENFLFADFLALDFDDPEFPLTHAQRAFAGLTHVIGTTRNHQREKKGVTGDRYRVVIPFAQRVSDVAIYRYNVKLALAMFEHADRSCKDGARPFFACRAIVEIEDDGEAWEVETPPAVSKRKRSTTRKCRGYLSATTRSWLEMPIPKGAIADTMFKLGCELRRAGFGMDDAMAVFESSATMRLPQGETDRKRYVEAVQNGYARQSRDEEK